MANTAAYKQVGYSPGKGAHANALRLRQRDAVTARIDALKAVAVQAALDAATVDAARIQRELEHLAFSDITELFTETESGKRKLKPFREWPESTRRAVSSVKVKRYVEGAGDTAEEVETTEFRLWPKNEAIRQLREHMGLVAPEGGDEGAGITIRVVRETRRS